MGLHTAFCTHLSSALSLQPNHPSPLSLAVAVVFPSPGQDSYREWGFGHPIVGIKAISQCELQMTFESRVFEVAQSLVKLCGLNPQIATVEDMDRCNERFYCTSGLCDFDSKLIRDLEIFTWRGALHHAYMKHADDECLPEFKPISHIPDERLILNIRDIARCRQKKLRDSKAVWICKICSPNRPTVPPTSWFDVTVHLEQDHHIHTDVKGHICPSEPHRRLLDVPVKVGLREAKDYVDSLLYLGNAWDRQLSRGEEYPGNKDTLLSVAPTITVFGA